MVPPDAVQFWRQNSKEIIKKYIQVGNILDTVSEKKICYASFSSTIAIL